MGRKMCMIGDRVRGGLIEDSRAQDRRMGLF